jgi:hypothetical protein
MAKKHYHRRRNPGNGIIPLVGGIVAGGLGSRMIPQALLGGSNTGVMGYLANGITAVGGGLLIKGVWKSPAGQSAGMGFIGGGLAALAIRIYQDYTSGAASTGSSDGTMGLYIGSSFVIPTNTTGNPLSNTPYNFTGAPVSVAAGGQPASAAAVSTAVSPNNYSRRLKGRFAPN